jgi:hypothetical protein
MPHDSRIGRKTPVAPQSSFACGLLILIFGECFDLIGLSRARVKLSPSGLDLDSVSLFNSAAILVTISFSSTFVSLPLSARNRG